MKRFFFLSIVFLTGIVSFSQAQHVEWKDVAHIFYNQCADCHRPGEIGEDYLNAMGYTNLIGSPYFSYIPLYVTEKLMPPWPANSDYRQFIDQRVLTPDEINLVDSFVAQVFNPYVPYDPGDTTLAPPPPVFTTGSQLGIPDTTLTMAQAFTIPGDGLDHYQVFALKTNLTDDREVRAIEFRPGNAKVVHHVFMYTCEDSSVDLLDAATPEYGYPSFGGAGESANVNFITLFGPGMNPRFYPNGCGLKFKANTEVVIQVHYSPGTFDRTDQSSVNLFYGDDPHFRLVKGKRVGEDYVVEPVFFIVKNKVLTFHSEYTLDTTYSMFSIAPHMHLLGKAFKLWAEVPGGDSIPLCYVDKWDFRWQLIYQFPCYVILPQGTIIHAEATYDNTANNPNNPNNPPVNVSYGESSFDEMMKYFMNLVPYQAGDEDTVFDASMCEAVGIPPIDGIVSTPQLYDPIPNPADDHTVLDYYLPNHSDTKIIIYDLSGREVDQMYDANESSGFHRKTMSTSSMIPGMYFCTLDAGGKRVTKPLIVQH